MRTRHCILTQYSTDNGPGVPSLVVAQGVYVNVDRLKQELIHCLMDGPKSWSKLVKAMNLSVPSTSSMAMPALSDDMCAQLIKEVATPHQGKGDGKMKFAIKDELKGTALTLEVCEVAPSGVDRVAWLILIAVMIPMMIPMLITVMMVKIVMIRWLSTTPRSLGPSSSSSS